MKQILNPPERRFKRLTDFPLKNIEKTFSYALFERKLSKRHVNKIVTAILNNQLYDNNIAVIKKNKHWEIIDGQHRIEALKIMRDKYGLLTYDIVLEICPESDARNIYRRDNLGRKLTLTDHLKAIDNGKIRLFNRLRQFYSFTGSKKKGRYDQIFNAIYYTKTKSMKPIPIRDIERFLEGITEDEIRYAREFTIAVERYNRKSIVHKVPLYRNLYKVGYENNFNRNNWKELIKLILDDKTVLGMIHDRKYESIIKLYDYLTELVPKTKVKWWQPMPKTSKEFEELKTRITQKTPIF